jgi:ABC-type nickel/cobalt efflux system permease component RcnA
MLSKRITLSITFALLISLTLARAAFAHPLGNFSINQYTGLLVSGEGVEIDYVLDMAEIPAFQEINAQDENGDGLPDPGEFQDFQLQRCQQIAGNMVLNVDGKAVRLQVSESAIQFPQGQAGLLTLRLSCVFNGQFQAAPGARELTFENQAEPDRLGWREIVVAAEGVELRGEFAKQSPSSRLTRYPDDLLSSPLDQRSLHLEIYLSGAAPADQEGIRPITETPLETGRYDAFTNLALQEEWSLATLVLAVFISMTWGAAHALTPGHGKAIVGAYLVGTRGTARHALYLGLTTTLVHTAGVFALGLVTLFAARYILPEKLFPWLSAISGLLVLGIGANLFLNRLRSAGLLRSSWTASQPEAAGHPHTHIDPGHEHALPAHPHPHEHGHSHATQSHSHPGHDQYHEHQHNGRNHNHLPPGAYGEPVTWRSLLALGFSGGIIPCPSALVMLLSAIALNRVGLGLLLVLAFSLGLAGVLTGIGLVFVYARRWFDHLPVRQGGLLLRLLPAASALLIALVGLGITARALLEMGAL